jgi:hypothetical protein
MKHLAMNEDQKLAVKDRLRRLGYPWGGGEGGDKEKEKTVVRRVPKTKCRVLP